MVLAVPLKECLYERSKDWMRALAPYKNPKITSVIQVFSYIGDGDFYFYVASFFYIFGKNEDFTYLSASFLSALQLCNFMKAFYHHSRPQYDDLSLADMNVGSCAGEFGNPSGHSLLSCQFIPTMILFCKQSYPNFFIERRFVAIFMQFVAGIFLVLICFGRFYLGRHSVDQILFGIVLGLSFSHFSHFFIKPRIYDPFFRKEHSLHSQITEETRWRAVKIASIICITVWAISVTLYLYVDNYVNIP